MVFDIIRRCQHKIQKENGSSSCVSYRWGSVDVAEFFASSNDKERYQEVLKMIEDNIFRYDAKGCVKFHGKLQENEFGMTSDSEIWIVEL